MPNSKYKKRLIKTMNCDNHVNTCNNDRDGIYRQTGALGEGTVHSSLDARWCLIMHIYRNITKWQIIHS